MRRSWVIRCAGALLGVAVGAWGAFGWGASTEASEPHQRPAVLQLTGRVEGARPDILFLAPRLKGAPKAWRKAFAAAAAQGTSFFSAELSAEAFCTLGPLPVLQAAGYQLLPVRDVPWAEACRRLADILTLRRKSRVEDGVKQAPICAVLSEETTPEELAETLAPLLETEAMLVLAPQGVPLPLIVVWRNCVWPAREIRRPVRLEHWIPTLAEIVGLPPPAEVDAVSVLPLLSGVGYQRPLELPLASLGNRALSARPCTMLTRFEKLPENCPWVPDFTDNRLMLKPADRVFFPSVLPLSAEAAAGLSPEDKPQGFYVRTAQKAVSLTFPAGVSCVIRVRERTVFSEWKPEKPVHWALDGAETVPLEIFLVVPPGMNPAVLPIFSPPPDVL